MNNKNYSLSLPCWGPYNKEYLGAAHIADKEMGLRFDLNLFPGYYRRSVMSVRDLADSGTKMMASSTDVSRFVYRYELEWKDKVYIEADFKSEDNVMTVTCDFVNNTDTDESLTLNAVMSMHGCSCYHKDVIPSKVNCSKGVWIDALDYTDINTSEKFASDGLYLCENRGSDFVNGSFIDGSTFGKKGDFLKYEFSTVNCRTLSIRYRGSGKITLKTILGEYPLQLPDSDGITVYDANINSGEISEFYVYTEDCKVDFDGFLINGEDAEFESCKDLFVPEYTFDNNRVKLDFNGKEYMVTTDCDEFVVRKIHTDDIGSILTKKIHDHVSEVLIDGSKEYVELFIRPVFVKANSKKTVTITVTAPNGECYNSNHTLAEPECNSDGLKYNLSQKIMSAVTLTNVVWPVYSRRGYILHNTPGRNWDSLYTWDSGFIGMGLLQLDVKRAVECLNAYMTPVGDKHSPYIMHGSPVPTQIFLYNEIYSKTGDIELLKEFYPYINSQYRFFADKRKDAKIINNGIFALWNVFYNSGGWDDYPPQKYVHNNKLEAEVVPVINTAMTVLCAKILKNLAGILNYDVKEYDEDIKFYSDAINNYAWDEQSGYYGYTKKDGSILKIDGVNGNMGMDGAFPFVAGISDKYRTTKILENIKNGMCTPIGVSVVDTRAPYYSKSGYWNGSVWMPHQWILWKACLDNGEVELASYIAHTALELWEKETSHTYNCYEHFMIENKRGAGFHQFSGLSTPVLMWFSAYYKPFTVTSGFMTVVNNKNIIDDEISFDVISTSNKPVVMVCLPENTQYTVVTKGSVTFDNNVCTIQYDGAVCDKVEFKKKNS